ncbi:hypothetical protein MGYG_03324 [Nannizzia gypsea CBS 118893]|uniref:DUF7730 domain-containing protein n=1 Tax=Arthroderma gypseum (strain ATCC MYA-4604 / CBS 118893) TaxID=535722 RepID=E4UN20_ARTGP|nr:hypothetical protein MGYG_03324 [Nannizzia gypsea CBS 118893]EFR00322.1 hypothetical protein MGYG_03324 [Nannizzia gypsea CBS 118893]
MTRECWYTLTDICRILCLPLLIPAYFIYTSNAFREYQQARTLKNYHKTDVLPLPARRQRALSIHDTLEKRQQQETWEKHAKEKGPERVVHDQKQSPLFQLPTELRFMIYECVLGSQKIHIVHTTSRQLAGINSTESSEVVDGDEAICNCVSENVVHANKKTGCTFAEDILAPVTCKRPGIGILSLIQSCRQIYTEAIEVLYARRTFSFEQPYTFLAFAHSILPQRLNTIPGIEIAPWDWSVFYNDGRSQFYRKARRFWPRSRGCKEPLPNTWEISCHVIAHEMENLKEFRLRAATEVICRPLYKIEKLKRFDIELCWPIKWEMPESAPFKIIAPSWGNRYTDY